MSLKSRLHRGPEKFQKHYYNKPYGTFRASERRPKREAFWGHFGTMLGAIGVPNDAFWGGRKSAVGLIITEYSSLGSNQFFRFILTNLRSFKCSNPLFYNGLGSFGVPPKVYFGEAFLRLFGASWEDPKFMDFTYVYANRAHLSLLGVPLEATQPGIFNSP